ncbi:MAG: hypothetical protein LBK55_05150 [Azoarcus sp.]|jgi:hypothetical protein|nr:hypothetical protein [Azoarcus sp.]
MACTLEPIANIANGVGRTGRRIWAATLIAALLALAAGSCAGEDDVPENPDLGVGVDMEAGMDMRNEIIEFVVANRGNNQVPLEQVNVTHLVEKYIKMGDDFESAKEILLKNGFDVTDHKGLKEYMTEIVYGPKGQRIVRARRNIYRLAGSYAMKCAMKWTKPLFRYSYYDWKLQIVFGRSPESERVDKIFAISNLRAF